MKSIKILLIIISVCLGFNLTASDTLFYRFNNYYIVNGVASDTLVFDLEIKSSTAGTYLVGFQNDIYFSTVVFGTNAQPVAIMPYMMANGGLVSPYMSPLPVANPTANSFRYGQTQLFGPYDPANLALVPVSTWGKLIRYKMLIINNSQNVGVQLNIALMAGQQKYIFVSTWTKLDYIPIVATNNLLNMPAMPAELTLMISELGDPNNSSADFVEIYNAGLNDVNFIYFSWFLTVYNGSVYQSEQLTGIINTGDSYVIGGLNYATAYPGKTADQISSIVDNNGAVAHYLTINAPYPAGTLIDTYNGMIFPYTGKHAVRKYFKDAPSTTFTFSEWAVTTAGNIDMTPGSHRQTISWDGSSSINWRDTANWTLPYVPDAGHNASIPNADVTAPDVQTGTQARCHNLEVTGTGAEAEILMKAVETSGENR